MDIAEYLNDHIAFAQKGRAVNWQEVAITVFNGMGQIIHERDEQIAALQQPDASLDNPVNDKDVG
jgi:hypothetical protein